MIRAGSIYQHIGDKLRTAEEFQRAMREQIRSEDALRAQLLKVAPRSLQGILEEGLLNHLLSHGDVLTTKIFVSDSGLSIPQIKRGFRQLEKPGRGTSRSPSTTRRAIRACSISPSKCFTSTVQSSGGPDSLGPPSLFNFVRASSYPARA